MEISIGKDLEPMGIFLGTDTLEGVRVRKSRSEVIDTLESELRGEIRSRYRGIEGLKDDRVARALRDFYWKIGIDPTKTRPSSEALVRRIFRKSLPRINNLVDAGNLASTRTMVPVGIYDIDRLEGDLTLRSSLKGENFRGIGGKDMMLDEGIPVLSDEKGVVHLYPHRDCVRTMITEDCTNAVIVTCGVRGMRMKLTEMALDEVQHYWEQLRE